TGSIAATAAILIARVTISPSDIPAAGGNCSPSNHRSSTINGTTPNRTTPNCTASHRGPSVDASALGDLHDLTVIGDIFGEVFWKNGNRRAHCRQDKQGRARKRRKGQLEAQLAQCHVVLLSALVLLSPVSGFVSLSVCAAHCPLVPQIIRWFSGPEFTGGKQDERDHNSSGAISHRGRAEGTYSLDRKIALPLRPLSHPLLWRCRLGTSRIEFSFRSALWRPQRGDRNARLASGEEQSCNIATEDLSPWPAPQWQACRSWCWRRRRPLRSTR